ncbi:MAG: ribosome silencing factor [Chloroflexi bacterium RBG_13_56_8]|nr:MAG: ribosome silencing factor [Chloroflexi bacterium RBG_13_56_8]
MELARIIIEAIAGKLGSDVLLLDLSGITIIADYFVIATGESTRQLRAIHEALIEQLKEEHHITPLSTEGTGEAGWLLLDYGSVVVHLFSEAQRRRYQIEELWNRARTVVRIA